MSQDNWTIPQTFADLLTHTQKRLSHLERREGGSQMLLQVIGPAQNKRAILIDDWNDEVTSNNGYFWSRPGALHSPDPAIPWTGSVIGRSDNAGMQEVWNTDDIGNILYFMRTYVDDGTGQGRIYSSWRGFPTPTGLIEIEHLGETVQDYLNDLSDAIDAGTSSLLIYEQTAAPVPGVAGVPSVIPPGSVWIDTDDNRHAYSWNGTTWVSTQSTLFAGLQTQIDTLTDEVEAAAIAASDAMDFATTLTMTYRQTTAPTNPDSNGRALRQDDIWFDEDDANKMYTWSGSAWVLLNIATESYASAQASAAQAAAIAAAAADATTKAGNAQSAAISAAAADATTKAANAQAAAIAVANTRNAIFRQSAVPTALAAGDIWYDTANGNRTYRAFAAGVNTIGASGWVLFQFGTSAIAADSITSALIAANTIVTGDLAATAIDGMTVTGATIQTVVTAARGIKINSTGLTAYNGSGTATLSIVGSTGAITMLGDLTSGSTVTGAVVTGGTIQSESTAARGIKITSGGLTAYDGTGIVKFTIDAATGGLTLAGALTGSGTITGPTFQTNGLASRGVKINGTGLVAYDGSGVTTLLVDGTTGAITMKGDLTTGSSVTGAVVTGGTIQSESTVARGIKMNSSGLTAYDGSGNPTFTLTAATGAVTLLGSLTGAGVITGPTLRGGLWETEATAARGIKVTSAGMIAYNGLGAQSFFLDAATGVMTATGGLLTGGSLTGGVVTGAVLQTSGVALTGIKINSSGLVAYDATNNTSLVVNASTGAIDMRGKLTATALTSLDNLGVYGVNNYVSGTLYAQNTINPPTVAPTVTSAWDVRGTLTDFGPIAGICPHPADSDYLLVIKQASVEKAALWAFNKTTGVAAVVTSGVGYDFNFGASYYTIGLATLSGDLFCLAKNAATGDYYMFKAVSGTGLSPSVLIGASSTFTGQPALGIDERSTPIMIVVGRISSSQSRIKTVTRSLVVGANTDISFTGGNLTVATRGTYMGAADFGTTDRLVQMQPSISYVTTATGTSVTPGGWTPPFDPQGLTRDVGSSTDSTVYFWGGDGAGNIYRLARNVADEYVKIGYSWADRVGTFHETTLGSGTTTYLRPARTMLLITTQPAPESGNAGAEAANQTGLYAQTAASMIAAAALASSALVLQDQAKILGNATQQGGYSGVDGSNGTITSWRIIEATKTTGTAPQVTNGFAAIASVGTLQSQQFTAGSVGWQFKGDGSAQMGPITVNSAGTVTGGFGGVAVNGASNPNSHTAATPGMRGAYPSAVPGATTGFAHTLPAGVMRATVQATGFTQVSGAILGGDVYFDGVYRGPMILNASNSALNAHTSMPTCAFQVTVAAGTHYMAFRQTAGVADANDYMTYCAVVTPA